MPFINIFSTVVFCSVNLLETAFLTRFLHQLPRNCILNCFTASNNAIVLWCSKKTLVISNRATLSARFYCILVHKQLHGITSTCEDDLPEMWHLNVTLLLLSGSSTDLAFQSSRKFQPKEFGLGGCVNWSVTYTVITYYLRARRCKRWKIVGRKESKL